VNVLYESIKSEENIGLKYDCIVSGCTIFCCENDGESVEVGVDGIAEVGFVLGGHFVLR
jgi:hypothetical protein